MFMNIYIKQTELDIYVFVISNRSPLFCNVHLNFRNKFSLIFSYKIHCIFLVILKNSQTVLVCTSNQPFHTSTWSEFRYTPVSNHITHTTSFHLGNSCFNIHKFKSETVAEYFFYNLLL